VPPILGKPNNKADFPNAISNGFGVARIRSMLVNHAIEIDLDQITDLH